MSRYWQSSTDADLYLEAEDSVVRKVYKGAREEALDKARREMEYLSRFWGAQLDAPHLACPEPLELALNADVAVRMRRMPGMHVQGYLLSQPRDPGLLARLAGYIFQAHELYYQTFGEPHFDFILLNMLYDEEADLLTLLDFSLPRHHRLIPDAWSPEVVAFGALLGSALYASSFPSGWWRFKRIKQINAVTDGAMDEAQQRKGRLDQAALERAAWSHYGRAARLAPSSRLMWYKGPGKLLALRTLRAAQNRLAAAHLQ